MTAPVSSDLAWLADLERAHAAWQSGSPGWSDRAIEAMESLPTLIAELRKRDAAPPPAAEPPHDLRDDMARTLYERDDAAEFTTWAQLPDWNRRMWLSDADALLAGPLAPLLDRLTRAEAAVQRVEAREAAVLADLLRLTYSVQPDKHPSRAARLERERVADAFRARIDDHCRKREAALTAALSPESVQS